MILKRDSSRNDGIYVVTERFIRTLKNKCHKHLTGVWKNVHIDKLDEKPADVKSGTYLVCDIEHNDKDPKFKIGDHVKISKNKIIFAKVCTPIWFEKVLVIKK